MPTAAWITIFWAVIVAINVGAVTVFGEVEVVASSIKFGWIFVVIISMIGTYRLSNAVRGKRGREGLRYT